MLTTRSFILLSALLVLGPALFASTPSPALAHAQYDSSTPAKREQLTVAPTEVTITFTQEIQKIAGTYDITVNKDRGPSVTAGPAVVNDADRTMMSVPLQPGLADGRYVVRWKNVSDADGDAAEGAYSFYLNYEPNTVDLENDNQLDQVGEEATPASDTPTGEATSGTTAIATSEPTAGGEAKPEATPGGGDDDDDGGSTSTIWVIVGAVAIGVAAGAGAYVFARSRRG